MKKYLNIAMILGVCLSILACGNKSFSPSIAETVTESQMDADKKNDGRTGMPNPVTSYASLDELNEAAGTKLVKPGIMGITNEQFNLINCGDYSIAEYTYDLNDISYTLRSAPVTEDISGVYLAGRPAFENNNNGQEFIYADDMKLARWYNGDVQYIFISNDTGRLENETFTAMAGEIKTLIHHFSKNAAAETAGESESEYSPINFDIAALAGHYSDSHSQRANMDAYVTEDNTLDITVRWSNSATETSCWHMTARLTSDGRLEYSDCSNSIIQTDETGNSSTEMIYESGCGYFTVENTTLLWNGAADENCRNCTFELRTQE